MLYRSPQVIQLYPHLVAATATSTPAVAASLQQALHQYSDLLQPPRPLLHNGNTPDN